MSLVASRSTGAGFTLAGGSATRCAGLPEPLAFLGDSTGVGFCGSTVRRAGGTCLSRGAASLRPGAGCFSDKGLRDAG